MRPTTLAQAAERMTADPNDDPISGFTGEFYRAPVWADRFRMLQAAPAKTGSDQKDALPGATACYLTNRIRRGSAP